MWYYLFDNDMKLVFVIVILDVDIVNLIMHLMFGICEYECVELYNDFLIVCIW